MRIRDPIHNFVRLPDDLAPLVNSSALQRLRGIRQLALANLVYPGALHTRFDHTLGVAHVAGLMAEQLRCNDEEKRTVRVAALLHDVGHGPFSHVSETSLARFADKGTLKDGQQNEKIHELVTAEIIRTDDELGRLLAQEERERVIRLLRQGDGRPILKQVVSGPLDADKQDYLLRDSRMCGVEYGTFDLHQLLRSLKAVGDRGEEELMIDPEGVHAVEQFVLAKYYMTANVYRHRVRLVTDQMIGRAIQLGIERDDLDNMQALYRFDNTPQFVRNYRLWDDGRFLETFCPVQGNAPGGRCEKMLRRLRERRLLKRVFRDRIESFDGRVREVLRAFPESKYSESRIAAEREVAEYLQKELAQTVDTDQVIVHAFGIKSARESSRNDESDIMVNCVPRPKTFIEESTLFQSINQAFADFHVEVYAPIAWPNPLDKDHREHLRQTWHGPIHEAISKQSKEARRQP